MEPSDTACLDIRLSTALGTLWRNAPLIDDVTQVGRPEAGEPGVNLEYLWVSRKHARIFREGTGEETTYVLENWNGPAGIRLYEKILRPGERHILRHGYVFHIPEVHGPFGTQPAPEWPPKPEFVKYNNINMPAMTTYM